MDKIHNHEVAGSIPAPATKEGSLLGLPSFVSIILFPVCS